MKKPNARTLRASELRTLGELHKAALAEIDRLHKRLNEATQERTSFGGSIASALGRYMQILPRNAPRPTDADTLAGRVARVVDCLSELENEPPKGLPMLIHCPSCGKRHVDAGVWETKVHHTHACQVCGHVWRPAVFPTVGVRFLPGYKNQEGST